MVSKGRGAALYEAFLASQILPHAWEEWCGYRSQVTDYLIGNSKRGTSLAIFGAGRCNDLDLGRLLGHFSQVTLLDVDEKAMWEGLEKYGDFERGKGGKASQQLIVFPVDFTGITAEDLIAFAEAFLRVWDGKDPYSAVYKAEEILSGIYGKSWAYVPAFPQKQFDYTVALGVHSQLGSAPAWMLDAVGDELCSRVRQWENTDISSFFYWWQEERVNLFRRIERESIYLARQLNHFILLATKEKAFLGYELCRAVSRDGIWYAVPDSYVTGAWQAAEDLKRLDAGGSIHFRNYFDIVWPFCAAQNKAYRMMIMEAEIVGKKG
ncbi:MAG: hypothetical protein K2N63_16495 [Lachnospiraceae bacterium]|nr:hypothetical protein [Lachnospiraceae bacterium]